MLLQIHRHGAAMIGPHPNFRHPPNPAVKLWRYTDLSKFVSLLQDRRLYFSRADKLGDPFEGSVTKANAVEVDYIVAHRGSDPNLASWKEMSETAIRQTFAYMSAHRKTMTEKMFVSCWHMSEYES